jgi:hypothetical protein
LPVDFRLLAGPGTISNGVLKVTGAGIIRVQAYQKGNGVYDSTSVEQSIKVNQASQTISFTTISNKVFGDAPFNLQAAATSQLPITFSVESGAAKIDGTKLTIIGTGLIKIQAFQAGDENYRSAQASQSFTVNKANQTITFTDIEDKLSNAEPFNLSATASSGLPILFKVVSGPATITGTQLSLTGPGQVKVEASQVGNEFYLPVAVEQTFTVSLVLSVSPINASEIEVYPNPASVYLKVIVPSSFNNASIELLGSIGQPVYRYNGEIDRITELPIGHLAKGFYLLRLSTQKEVYIHRIIIQ